MSSAERVRPEKGVSYKVRPGFELKEIVGRSVVVYMGSDEEFNGIIRLNEEGVFVWKLLIEGADIDSITDKLAAEYDAERSIIMDNVEEVLASLITEDVIEPC